MFKYLAVSGTLSSGILFLIALACGHYDLTPPEFTLRLAIGAIVGLYVSSFAGIIASNQKG